MNRGDRIRFLALLLVVVAGFALVIVSLSDLQVRGADDYGAIAESTMVKTLYERGSRGQVLDVDGAILAFDKKIYNVEFYRNPSSSRTENGEYSKAIWEAIQILERAGKEVKFDFYLVQDAQGVWSFDTKTTDTGVAQKREQMFRQNFYVVSMDTQNIFSRLCYNYMIDQVSPILTTADKLRILSVWQEMQMNAFNTQPITLSTDLDWATVIEIETRQVAMPGISIRVENQRVYPKGTLACHILGYVGLMQSQTQLSEFLPKGYQRTDSIGLDGVEKSMEEWLTANSNLRQGTVLVEIDRYGRRIRELSRQEPLDGNTVKLTIRADLQAEVEKQLAYIINKVRNLEESLLKDSSWLEKNKDALLDVQAVGRDLRLAQNGAIVVLDMECRVLAMASFPNYDPNLFVIGMTPEERERMLLDPRNPLYNNAIAAADTPGSVFKMATALAALANGKLTVTEEISDEGYFTLYDSVNPPKCWVALNQRTRHRDQTIVTGLSHSCNYFFYTIASRLGDNGDGSLLYEYAAKLGLTSKTNIDLPGERRSVVGNQRSLYDPALPINGSDQDTWYPVQVFSALKTHLRNIGVRYNITYAEDRLDKCAKALMDMAVVTDQGYQQQGWVRAIRPILMEELGMSMEMVYLQIVVGDIVILLNEIKWGGSYTIMTAIGQSITLTTPIAMARYMAAVANGGYVYDVRLIDSIIAPSGETVLSFDEPVLVNDLSAEIGPYIPYIHEGLANVVDEGGTAAAYFTTSWLAQYPTAGKTGTAQKSKLDVENNAWFVSMAPTNNPEIVVVVYIPYGYAGARASEAAKNVIEYYLKSKVEAADPVLPAPNGLAQ